MSVGALNTMFSDQPGPYRLRMWRMLATAAAAGASAFAGYVLGDSNIAMAVAALLWGFAGGLLVALGPNAARVGLVSMILLVVTAADPLPPREAIGPALLIFAGGALLTLFAIAAWPLQRYRPERTALAGLCRGLAASTRRRDDSAQALPVTQALTDVEGLLHGEYRARGVAMDAFRVLGELIERIRLELLALGAASNDATVVRLREYAARALDAIAVALDAGTPALTASAALEGFDAAVDALAKTPDASDDPMRIVLLAHARALGGQLRAAVRNADFAGSRGELRLEADEARLPRELRARSPIAILRANLRLSSIACRHAIRCAVCLTLALVGERMSGLSHGYWIPMTTAIVLKPDFAGTFSFGLLRVIGTLLGLALATALVHFAFGDEWLRIALLALFCYGFRQLTTMHYGVGVMLLTGLIVVLLSFAGMSPADTMSARAIGTKRGHSLALLAYVVWPTWEHGRVGADAGRPARRLSPLFRRRARRRLACTRRRTCDLAPRAHECAGLARPVRGEPSRDRRAVAMAEGVFANANRFLRAAMALEQCARTRRWQKPHPASLRFAARVDAILFDLTRHLRDGTTVTNDSGLRPLQSDVQAELETATSESERIRTAAWIDASDRITNAVNTIAHLLLRDAEHAVRASG